jgi:hypothetical protein
MSFNNTINTITIENISKYILEFKDGSLIATPKMKINEESLSEELSKELSEDELLKKDYGSPLSLSPLSFLYLRYF